MWNYEEATSLNSFENHEFPDKGISKLCLLNELDDSLLLVASCRISIQFTFLSSYLGSSACRLMICLTPYFLNIADGNVRIWKDYTVKSKQMLVTAFSSIQGPRPGVRVANAVVDWQQQSGYLVSPYILHAGFILLHLTLFLL